MKSLERRHLALYLAVGGGAALGALLRYALMVGMSGLGAPGVLWATVTANVVGSLVIALFAALTAPDGRLLLGSEARQFVMAGLCGGFTTFSLASLDTFSLLARRDFAAAGLYLGATIGLSLMAVWIGHRLALRINR